MSHMVLGRIVTGLGEFSLAPVPDRLPLVLFYGTRIPEKASESYAALFLLWGEVRGWPLPYGFSGQWHIKSHPWAPELDASQSCL
jgi:hypothetical protein